MRELHDSSDCAIVIGASAGAIQALTVILAVLPIDYPFPILIVVHVPPHKGSPLAHFFDQRCAIAVKEADDKEFICASTVYFAPPDYHLLVEPDYSLSLSNEAPVLYSRPAIDVLFETAADAYGDSLTGIVLTGASRDGASGLRSVCAAGGTGWVQSPETAEGKEMPRAALKACPSARSLSLEAIAFELLKKKP